MDISFTLWCFKKLIKCQIISKKKSPPLTLMFILYAFLWCSSSADTANYKLALPRAFARNWATAAWALPAFHAPCRGFRVDSEALCAPGKLVEQVFRYWYFQERISCSQSLHLLPDI